MSRLRRRYAIGAVGLVLLGSLVLTCGVAAAQVDPGTTTTIASTETSSPAPTTTTAPENASRRSIADRDYWLGAAILALGALIVGAVVIYLNKADDRYHKTVKLALSASAGPPVPVFPSPRAGDPIVQMDATGGLVISPPWANVVVGTEAGPFTLTHDTTPVPDPEWTIEPKDSGEMKKKGDGWWFTAKAAGKIRVTAKSTVNNAEETGSIEVTALAPQARPSAWKLPYIGQGYGAILIAIGVAAFVAAGMVIDEIPAAAGVTFLTAVVGYFFVASAASQGTGDGGSAAGAGGSTGAGAGGTGESGGTGGTSGSGS